MEKSEIEAIARIAATEALSRRDDIVQEELDTRYHDVKLLMNNYRKLKAHYENIEGEELEVTAICTLKHKTKLMMGHVDRMLAAYKALCSADDNPDEMRRWRALYLRYIDPARLTVSEIALKLSIDRRTFFRDINRAFADMAVLLFGLEAIGTWNPRKK